IKLAIGKCHCEFRIHIGERPYAPNNHSRLNLAHELHRQPGKLAHLDIAQRPRYPLDETGPFVRREKWLLVDVCTDPHNELIHKAAAPLDHVRMAERNGIEGASVHGASGHSECSILEVG